MCRLVIVLFLLSLINHQVFAFELIGTVISKQGKVIREPIHKKKIIKKLFSEERFMEKTETEEVNEGDAIYVGDKMTTEDKSLLRIKMNHNTMITLGPKSKLEIKPEETKLQSGILRTLIPHGNPDKIKFTTPHAAMGIRGTEFITQVKNDKTIVALLSGSLDMNQGRENRELLKKHSIQISHQGFENLKPLSDALVFLLKKSSIEDNVDLEILTNQEKKSIEVTKEEPTLRKSFKPKTWEEILLEKQSQ